MADKALTAELLIKARDATGNALGAVANKFKLFGKTTQQSLGALTGWGNKFQKEIERLKLAPRYIDRTAQAWARLQKEWVGKGPPTTEWLAKQEAWKDGTLSQLRQVSAAYERAAQRNRRIGSLFGGVPGMVGAYGGYRVGRSVAERIGEQQREGAREWLGGMSPAETAQATAAARAISAKYPSVGPVAVMEHIRLLRARFGDFGEAMKNVEQLVKAQVVLQTLTGGENSSGDLEQLVLGLESLGAGADPAKFRTYLDAFVKAKSLYPDITGEAFTTYLKRSKASKYGLGPAFLANVSPTIIQHEGATQFGTEQASAFSALVGQRQTKKAQAVMGHFGLLNPKTGSIVDEAGFVDDPRKWTQEHLRPQLEKHGLDLTPENKDRLIAEIQKMFSNRNVGEFFTSLLVNEPVIKKDSALLAGAKGTDAASGLRARDPFVALQGVTEQMGAFVQVVGGPFGEKAASVLNSIADAIAKVSKSAGDDPKKAETWGEYAGLGGGLLSALIGRKLLRAGGRFLLDIPRAAGGVATAAGGGLGAAFGWLTGGLPLALALGGDTMASGGAWNHYRPASRMARDINKWKLPADWDYTLGSGGGFGFRPGSTKGGFTSAMPSTGAMISGSADIHVNVQVEPSEGFISRLVSALRNDIVLQHGSGGGTAGSTGLSMPEATPAP